MGVVTENAHGQSILFVGDLSGDKKATMLSLQSRRGRKVVAGAVLQRDHIRRFLHSTLKEMAEYCRVSTLVCN